jgi:hypothetical protein
MAHAPTAVRFSDAWGENKAKNPRSLISAAKLETPNGIM